MKKTLKREVAGAGLFFWLVVSCYLVWWADPARIAALGTIYATQTVMVWSYAAAAFGLQALSTQFAQRK